MSKELSEIVDGVVRRVLEEKSGVSSAQPVKQNTLSKMTLAAAREIIKAVETKARDMGVNAVVAVSDAGGNPVAVECMDGAFLASYDIALNKAYTVVALKMPTSKLAELAKPGGSLYGIQHTNGGKIVIFGGGEPLETTHGIIGGLGVSGGTAEQDTKLGAYGKEYFEKHIF